MHNGFILEPLSRANEEFLKPYFIYLDGTAFKLFIGREDSNSTSSIPIFPSTETKRSRSLIIVDVDPQGVISFKSPSTDLQLFLDDESVYSIPITTHQGVITIKLTSRANSKVTYRFQFLRVRFIEEATCDQVHTIASTSAQLHFSSYLLNGELDKSRQLQAATVTQHPLFSCISSTKFNTKVFYLNSDAQSSMLARFLSNLSKGIPDVSSLGLFTDVIFLSSDYPDTSDLSNFEYWPNLDLSAMANYFLHPKTLQDILISGDLTLLDKYKGFDRSDPDKTEATSDPLADLTETTDNFSEDIEEISEEVLPVKRIPPPLPPVQLTLTQNIPIPPQPESKNIEREPYIPRPQLPPVSSPPSTQNTGRFVKAALPKPSMELTW